MDSAYADNGLHQDIMKADGFSLCPVCHRSNIKGVSEQEICLSCHGHNGTGAQTDVEWGILRRANGVIKGGLRGGGFAKGLMDPDLTGAPVMADVTSSHVFDGTSGIAWGAGRIKSTTDSGMTISLTCVSCHDPHGNGNYRSLRKIISGPLSVKEEIILPDEANKNYEITYVSRGYRDVSYSPANMNKWCSQCHTRYMAGRGASLRESGDVIFRNRHITDGRGAGCLDCHMAHGTTATMGTYSGAVKTPDNKTGRGINDSRLLSVSNRGGCMQCHSNIGG